MSRAKIHAVATYVARRTIMIACCSIGAGLLTEAVGIFGGYTLIWNRTGVQPPGALMAGLAALSAPVATSVMGIVGLLGLVFAIIGAFFQIIGDPNDPNDPLNQGSQLLVKPPGGQRPPIMWTEE